MRLSKSLLAGAFLLAGVAQAAPVYVVTDLGGLRGSGSTGINNHGQVVGWISTQNNANRAAMWQNNQPMDLGFLGGSSSWALGASDNGYVVGGSDLQNNSASHAFLWQSGQMTDLGTLGGIFSEAWDVNDHADVVGGAETQSRDTHAFLWRDGQMVDLGTLGGNGSRAYGINGQGQVIGEADTSNWESHAFLWQNGSMTGLGTLGGTYSSARDINAKGQIVGFAATQNLHMHAFLWQNEQMTDLGTLGGTFSLALGINNHSQVVGYSLTQGDNEYHAFFYEKGEIFDLNSLLAPTSSGWQIYEARGINNKGQIAASGCHIAYGCRALRLDVYEDPRDVPVPAPLALMGIGLAALAWRRQRSV